VRFVNVTLSSVCLVATIGGCGRATSGPTSLKTFADSASYAIGMNMAISLERSNADIELPAVISGLSDRLEQHSLMLTEEQANAVLQRLTTQLREAQMSSAREESAKNETEGEAYLAENGHRAGVITTPSGLQYEVLREGTGPKPTLSDRVRVHYAGTLIDGKEFDSSYKRGEPIEFDVRGVIPGWTEALQLMSVGSKYRLVIPGSLAYGPQGSPPDIGPMATLIFEVELLAIP